MEDIEQTVQRKSFRKYELPPLSCSFPFKFNEFEKNPNNEWIDWGFRSSAFTKEEFDKIKGLGTLVAHIYPLCDDINRYEILVKYFIMFFVFDDHTECKYGQIARNQDQSKRIWKQFEQMLVKLEGKQKVSMSKWEPYVLAMYAVLEDMYVTYNDLQKKRFIEVWSDYMQGNIEETNLISSGRTIANLEQLNKIRAKSVGVKPTVQAFEFADQLVISEVVWDHPLIKRLIHLAQINLLMVDDFFSFEKELKETKNMAEMFNTVAVISLTNGLPIDKSFVETTKLIAENEELIHELEDQILSQVEPKAEAETLIERINYMIGGNHQAHTILDRYNMFNE